MTQAELKVKIVFRQWFLPDQIQTLYDCTYDAIFGMAYNNQRRSIDAFLKCRKPLHCCLFFFFCLEHCLSEVFRSLHDHATFTEI